MKAKIRDKYQSFSPQELIDKAYELGANFEMKSFSCSQSTVAAIHELLEMEDVVVKVATSSCVGTANQSLGSCGALVGGVMAIDYFCGRPVNSMSSRKRINSNINALFPAFVNPSLLANKFWKEYGTIICSQIHRQLFGRILYLADEDEMEKFERMGAHSEPDKCGHIVGNAAKWVMEILIERGVVEIQ